ncbi:MAG: CHAD domain-containing protein [Chloroflexota bacterium]
MTTPKARPVEVELKYRVRDEAAIEHRLADDAIGSFVGASPVRTTQLEDRYVDTADGALGRAGFAVRLRQSARGTIVSVKSRARHDDGGDAHRREELEGPAHRTAGPLEWPASDARSLILELAGDAPLVEVVTIRQLRRKREIRDGYTRAELSLDEVDVVARSGIIDRFVELEVELIKGDEARLSALAEVLRADPALAPSAGSKFESALVALRDHGPDRARRSARASEAGASVSIRSRGDIRRVALANGDPGRAVDEPQAVAPEAPEDDPAARRDTQAKRAAKATSAPGALPESPEVDFSTPAEVPETPPPLTVGKTPGVTGDDPVAEAGRKVMRFHLARMIAKEPGTRLGRDSEELHGMRVATRRMRASWRVFGGSFRGGRTKRHRKGLRETASRLGAVRDLDVLLEAAEAYRNGLPVPEQRALDPLLSDWRDHRDEAQVLLLRELDSDDYRRWLDDYRDFVRTEGAGVSPVGPLQPHRIRDTAPSRIWTAYEQVRAYEPVLRWADVETLHELRIAGKWLRYTLEFVREALGPDVEPLIARVVALQDHLGLLHDADVAASLARTFLVEHAGSLTATQNAAIGRYLLDRERETARLKRTVGPIWRRVAGIGFRRQLGRVVAGL